MENSMKFSQKTKTTTWLSNSTPGHVPKKKQTRNPNLIHALQHSWKDYLHLPRYGSNLSVINGWMDKDNVLYIQWVPYTWTSKLQTLRCICAFHQCQAWGKLQLAAAAYCWCSFSSKVFHLSSFLQSVTLLAYSLNSSPYMPPIVLYYEAFQVTVRLKFFVFLMYYCVRNIINLLQYRSIVLVGYLGWVCWTYKLNGLMNAPSELIQMSGTYCIYIYIHIYIYTHTHTHTIFL